MGAAENRQILAQVEQQEASWLTTGWSERRDQLRSVVRWSWHQLNEVWHILFYASVVRRVGPESQDVTVRNSLDELRYRY